MIAGRPGVTRLPTDLLGVGQLAAEHLGKPRPARIGDERLQLGHIARQLVDEGAELVADDRRDQPSRPRQAATITTMTTSSADTARLMPEPLGPSRDRIEQIGQRHAGDERQQHIAEQPEHARRIPRAPRPRTPTCRSRAITIAPRRRAGRLAINGRLPPNSCGAPIRRDRGRPKARSRPRPAPSPVSTPARRRNA